MARAFTSGRRDLPCNGFLQGDSFDSLRTGSSLRLKNSFARDDATARKFKLTQYRVFINVSIKQTKPL